MFNLQETEIEVITIIRRIDTELSRYKFYDNIGLQHVNPIQRIIYLEKIETEDENQQGEYIKKQEKQYIKSNVTDLVHQLESHFNEIRSFHDEQEENLLTITEDRQHLHYEKADLHYDNAQYALEKDIDTCKKLMDEIQRIIVRASNTLSIFSSIGENDSIQDRRDSLFPSLNKTDIEQEVKKPEWPHLKGADLEDIPEKNKRKSDLKKAQKSKLSEKIQAGNDISLPGFVERLKNPDILRNDTSGTYTVPKPGDLENPVNGNNTLDSQ